MLDDMSEKIRYLLSDEESMRQIQELAAMFGGSDTGNERSDSENSPPDIDPAAIMKLMSGLSQNDKNCELLLALRPLLSEEKRPKVDKAVKLLRLFNVYTELKESGAIGNLF